MRDGFGIVTAGRVLVVEEDFLIAEQIRGVLSDAGYEVVGVTRRTAGAREAAGSGRVELAIVSMMLEVDVDGIRTATALHRTYGVKVLITTGFPDQFVRQHMNSNLPCGILKKPFSDGELLTAVAACFVEAA